MEISETARRNRERLFPGRVSSLAETDPELAEIFDNFAFDEAAVHDGLDPRTRLMVQLAALIGCQALGPYRVMLGAALGNGVSPVEAKEIGYQAVPYAGMGRALDFIHATNDVLAERGVRLPLDGQSTSTPATRAERGRAVQGEIVGADRVDRMYASAPASIPRRLSPSEPREVTMTTGSDERAALPRMARVSSMPSSSGISMSVTTSAMWLSRSRAASASRPSRAVTTGYPAVSSMLRCSSRTLNESSTTRILGGAAGSGAVSGSGRSAAGGDSLVSVVGATSSAIRPSPRTAAPT